MAKRRAERRRLHNDPIVRRVAAILATGEPTRFAFEAACRAGIRSQQCLRGVAWGEADAFAALVVKLALHRIGVTRPSWREAQPEARDLAQCHFCAACGNVIEVGRRTKYCSLACKTVGVARIRERRTQTDQQAARSEFYAALARGESTGRACLHCAATFQLDAHHPWKKYCSKACSIDARRVDRQATCEHCGAAFSRTDKQHKFCSPECGTSARRIERSALCASCGDGFTIHGTRDRQFCSKSCASRARHAARREALRCEAKLGIRRLPPP